MKGRGRSDRIHTDPVGSRRTPGRIAAPLSVGRAPPLLRCDPGRRRAIASSGSQDGEEANPSKGSRPSGCRGVAVISSLLSGPPLDPLRLCDTSLLLASLCLWGDQKESQRRKASTAVIDASPSPQSRHHPQASDLRAGLPRLFAPLRLCVSSAGRRASAIRKGTRKAANAQVGDRGVDPEVRPGDPERGRTRAGSLIAPEAAGREIARAPPRRQVSARRDDGGWWTVSEVGRGPGWATFGAGPGGHRRLRTMGRCDDPVDAPKDEACDQHPAGILPPRSGNRNARRPPCDRPSAALWPRGAAGPSRAQGH